MRYQDIYDSLSLLGVLIVEKLLNSKKFKIVRANES